MLTSPFLKAKYIIEKIKAHNFHAYFVGGAVRDHLLGRDVNDIDIASSARPEQIQSIFKTVIPVGLEHGTVIVRHKSLSYEVTTFRGHKSRNDGFLPSKSIEEDLQGRDFTINALAMDKTGKIIDLFNGREDLNNGVIRAVLNPEDRFLEDPLRMLRAIRFSSELGFTIEKETLHAISQFKDELNDVAIERLNVEMTKCIQGKHVNKAMNYLKATELYHFLPLFKDNHQLFEQLPVQLTPFNTFGQFLALIILRNPDLSLNYAIKLWKCSNETKSEVQQLIKAITEFDEKGLTPSLVYHLDHTYYPSFSSLISLLYKNKKVELESVYDMYKQLPINSRKDINFSGHDLLRLFPHMKRGPWISLMLEQIEEHILIKELTNTEHDIKEWVLCNPPEVN